MANPNIAAASQIFGRTELQQLSTTPTAIATTTTDRVIKINALIATNITTVDVSVTADIFRSSVATKLVNQILIPPNSSIVIVAKENPFYLQEGDALRLSASAASSASAVCSFEEFVT
ncbi:hypothetical protein [Sphingorhabdus sp.]|uniref:hypothetical protein n=1 Tax=Sphingorhabdus sp. TaxID=1902408 RepID=UPI0033410E4C